jgi:hypothetical protein
MELLDQLEAENPENPALAPKVSQACRAHMCAAVCKLTVQSLRSSKGV